MTVQYITDRLEKNVEVFRSLLEDISDDEYLFKPSSDKWCLLEVVCHLADEEIEDFRARVRHTIFTPEDEAPGIDPAGRGTSRKYIEQDFTERLNRFLEERKESVNWLRILENPNWDNAYIHPKFGPMTAKFFLTNWLAHDYLHIRQIIRLKYEYLKKISGEDLQYAGEW
jgi:hypothetical protein